ncbi:alpha/beta hydrolase [uncultured Tateyamaria sp.]|uniref:alpha/beta hydrolase n=1 Tax=Tateyamaria sp. 1078 TaxID=3417464 RepID=UPI00262CDA8C|nr:alpha/beta hydrolase [uncultured Tateyamaria sp.]
MPILRLNARPTGLSLHGSPAPALPALRRAAAGTGPVMILIHGFKYDPDDAVCSPHVTIFGHGAHPRRANGAWLRPLGFGEKTSAEGLAIAFGWRARGDLGRASQSARVAGQHLVQVIRALRSANPERPIHAITHSMGSEVIFEALHGLAAGDVDRIVTLTGATYASRAAAALQTPAGRAADLFNITSRENDVFDFLYERLTTPPVPGDGAMGAGVDLPNVVNIQLDCPRTLHILQRFGGHIALPRRRMCHWSSYTRPGALQFYARALREPGTVPLTGLRANLPPVLAPRWSRMFAPPRLSLSLPVVQKAAS